MESKEIKISTEPPAIYAKLKQLFGVDFDKGIIITYGDTIHTKHPERLTKDLIVHESTHIEQQKKIRPEAWWHMYITDSAFRKREELEAYRAQFAYIKTVCKDRNELVRVRTRLSVDMATIYGDSFTQFEAFRLLDDKNQPMPSPFV